ncbi:hypothetical protein [Nocardia sp. NPDC020380]|uniref:hypothetical protein n=1 Tax=Nocardia sp. NPDC020380 TaxID=3364309 RepID=UPI0037BAE56F
MSGEARKYLGWLSVPAAAALIAGCGGSGTTDSTTTTSAPPPLDVSFRWTNAASELTSPDATFVRAFIESWQAVAYSGKLYDVYPGFGDANHGIGLDGIRDTGPATYKSVFMNLLRVENSGGQTTKAVVCLWIGAEEPGGFPTELTYFHRGQTPPGDQSGVAKRPGGNVFGGWYATRMRQAASSDPDSQACDAIRPADLPSQFAVLSPVPGWPGSS